MNITKFVRRTQKWFLWIILILLIGGLVITFAPGSSFSGQSDESKLAGEFKDRFGRTIKITRGEFQKHKQKALAIFGFQRFLYSLKGYRFPNPKDQEINKMTWDNIILLHDAELNNVYVEDIDVQNQIFQIYGGRPTKEFYEQTARAIGAPYEVFEEAIRDNIKVGKLLELLASSDMPLYSDVYKDFEQSNKLCKIKSVSLDPKDFEKDVPPPSETRTEKYFDDHKEEFRIGNKIQIDYILVETDKIKDSLPLPSENDIKDYYEQNKGNYEIKDSNPKAYKQLAEVKADIITKLKDRNATTKAYEIANKINLAIGDELSKTTSDKVDLQTIAQKNNTAYDLTPFFDKGKVADIEKLIGGGSKMDEAFSYAKGQISEIVNTTKGSVIYRVLATQDSYITTPLLEEVRDKVVKAVVKEEAEKLSKKRAEEIADEMTKNGCEKVAEKYNLVFESSGYFDKAGKVDSKISSSAKTVDKTLSTEAFKLKVGQATYLDVGGKPNIVYVEDSRPILEDLDKKIDEIRKGKMNEKRQSRIQDIRNQITQVEANLQDYIKSETK